MKSLKSFLPVLFVSLLLATGIVTAFGTDAATTLISTVSFSSLFYATTVLNIIPMPTNILGTYVGAPGVSTESGSAGVQVINSERARGVYMSYATRPEYAGKKIVQGYLRLEAVIKNTDGKLIFRTFTGDGTTVSSTEERLDRNDKFVISEIGLFLLKQVAGQSNGRLQAYPNATEFGAAAPFLESVFNGKLSIVINREKFLPALDTQRFLSVPETQQSAGTNRDQFNLKKQLVHLTPHIELDGSGTNEVEVSYPTYTGWAGASAVDGTDHKVVLYMHGLLITGGSANT